MTIRINPGTKPLRIIRCFAMVSAACLLCSPSSRADVVVGAISVSSPQGDFGGGLALVNMINQSGLSAPYQSGVTGFDGYVATTTHDGANGFTATEDFGPQQFTFDLGVLRTINGVAIWNTTSVGAVNSFSVFADNDADFGNGTGDMLLGPTPLAYHSTPNPAQAFGFAVATTRFVHINALDSNEPPDFYGLGEVAFSGIPEPSNVVGIVLAILAGVLIATRRDFLQRSRT